MSEWQKKENAVENTSEPADNASNSEYSSTPRRTRKRRSDAGKKHETSAETRENKPEPAEQVSAVSPERYTGIHAEGFESNAVKESSTDETVRSSLRYTAGGRRRGRYRFAAPIGLLVLLLAAVGVISLIGSGVNAVKRAQDDTPLKNELSDFLSPVMQYKPQAFTDVNDTKQDTLLLASIWRITDAENKRQSIQKKKENTITSNYQMDDLGRMMIPVSEIEESYAYLFGPSAVLYHHTIGDEGKSFTTEYDQEQGYYHVPFISSSSLYVPVIDTLKKKGDTVTVRVGYVLSTKIGIDDKGKSIDPTPDMADEFQKYTVKKNGDKGWMLISISDEKTTSSSTTKSGNSDSASETIKKSEVNTETKAVTTETDASAAASNT